MSMSTEYCRYVSEWSQETDPVHAALVVEGNHLTAGALALPEAEREAYWVTHADEAERIFNAVLNHDDPRLDYYGGHMMGVYDEHWDAFARWAADKGYHVYRGMPMWHSMTVWQGPDRPQQRLRFRIPRGP